MEYRIREERRGERREERGEGRREGEGEGGERYNTGLEFRLFYVLYIKCENGYGEGGGNMGPGEIISVLVEGRGQGGGGKHNTPIFIIRGEYSKYIKHYVIILFEGITTLSRDN